MKKIVLSVVASLFFAGISAQNSLPEDVAYKIKNEGFSNSQIEELSEFMTDELGSRLAASQMKLRAEKMVINKLNEIGLSNARTEFAADFTKGGWDNEKNYVAMTYPYYCSFSANPKAWSGSTDGLVKGECILLDVKSVADLDKYKGKLTGKIVLMPVTQTYNIKFEPLAERLSEEYLKFLESDPRPETHNYRSTLVSNASAPRSRESFRAQMELQRAISAFLKEEKALAIINGRGAFNVPGASGVQYKVGDPEPTPELILPIEDHGRMARMLAKGEKVEMELEIRNKFTDNQQINNVIAEIPGSDPKLKNEIVLIGAHLDSWHGGTGGADNASGCIVMIEAMRIIKALGIQPKRTIRIALWGGEEQGLYGSRGYAQNYLYNNEQKKALSGYDKFAIYLNMDNGSGRFRGIYLEENDQAMPFMEAWKKSVESLGFKTLSLRKTGSTDHVTFNRLGLPAYQFIQDPLEYDRTYHTVMDTYERLSLNDLKVNSVITAWIALSAAMDNARIPLKPGYPENIPTSPRR